MLEKIKKNKLEWINYLAFWGVGVGIILVYFILKNLNSLMDYMGDFILLIRPILIALVIAYIANRPLQFIEEGMKKLWYRVFKKEISSGTSRRISILLLFLIVVGFLYLLFEIIIPPILKNLRLLLESLPVLQLEINHYIDEFGPFIQSIVTQDQLNEIVHFVTDFLRHFVTNMLQFGTGVITNVTGFAISTLTTIILSIYFLKDKEVLIDSFHKGVEVLFPRFILRPLKQLLIDLDTVFGGFLIAQLIAAILAGICSTIILLIIKHPFAILVGLVTGVANVIPYIGPILGAVLGFVLGLFSSWQLAVLSLVLLTIYQQLDANVIQPKLLSNSVGLHPVWVLITILIGGHYLGMLGMIVSIPTTALIKIYLSRRYYRKKQEEILLYQKDIKQ